jgi:broad specificity phosphatase PhoE
VTKFLLIRHAENDFVGQTLVGRRPGIHLNSAGRDQSVRLAKTLAPLGVAAIFSSPLERAIETATPLAESLKLKIQTRDSFNEIDFGDWTGRTFAELSQQEHWKQWNSYRIGNRAPGGETMLEVQTRFVTELERLRRDFSNQCLAIFSHGDPLRSVLLHYLGMPLDFYHRLQIATASSSILSLGDWAAELHGFNLQ